MTQTKEGYAKIKKRLIDKLGEAGYLEMMHQKSSKGGKNSSGYEFGHGKVDPAVIGAKGGAKSRRRKAVK